MREDPSFSLTTYTLLVTFLTRSVEVFGLMHVSSLWTPWSAVFEQMPAGLKGHPLSPSSIRTGEESLDVSFLLMGYLGTYSLTRTQIRTRT